MGNFWAIFTKLGNFYSKHLVTLRARFVGSNVSAEIGGKKVTTAHLARGKSDLGAV